jgi:hypothetical protein
LQHGALWAATAKIEADRRLFPGRIAQIVWAPTFFDDKHVCEFALASIRLGFGAEGFQLPLTCAKAKAITSAQRTAALSAALALCQACGGGASRDSRVAHARRRHAHSHTRM